MSFIGQVLLWFGFLSGSLATVYEIKDDANLSLTIPWFVVSALVLVAGIALIWIGKTQARVMDESSEGNVETLRRTISNLVVNAAEIQKMQDKLPPSQILQNIDDRCAVDFQEFADNRKSLIVAHDLNVYAEVMTQFAAGERAMNRAWSASADGYVDEVRDCLSRSHEHLLATQELLEKLKND